MALVILDRDGVINEDSDDYIRTVEQWRPIPGSLQAIVDLSRAGFRIAIATNQSGLARGYFDLDTLEAFHAGLCERVEAAGGEIAGIFYCPHHPDDGCDCRKPATGLLDAIERELGESVRGACFVGDSLKDLQAARARDCRPILVLTGKGHATARSLQADEASIADAGAIEIYADLATAAAAIIEGG